MIECLIDHLSKCPVFDGKRINANYLGGEAPSYSLENCQCDPVVKRYADGGMLCEKKFILALRAESSPAAARNTEVALGCERIEQWIRQQTKLGVLPKTGEGIHPCSFEVTKSFAVSHTASVDVRFEAELSFVFYVMGNC